MAHRTLIQPAELDARMNDVFDDLVVVDCGFDLADPAAGRRAHAAGHIPGAAYLHLDDDLSGPKGLRSGRHPLPGRDALARRLGELGVGADTQVVAYDASGGMFAARLWWLLRWLGHPEVAVLDGGLQVWRAQGLPVEQGEPAPRPPAEFVARAPLVGVVDREAVLARLGSAQRQLVDARSPDRFRGENETLDPVGGHIPGARNRFFRDNLDGAGRFKPAEQLRAELAAAANGRAPGDVVMSCGSGVTACHNLLAMEIAGLPGAALYPGSWSEWCAWPGAPVATGDD